MLKIFRNDMFSICLCFQGIAANTLKSFGTNCDDHCLNGLDMWVFWSTHFLLYVWTLRILHKILV